MPEALIIDAVRTPVGRHGGALASVEEVYFGCANQAGEDNRNVARMALILAGFTYEIPAVTFNRLCAAAHFRFLAGQRVRWDLDIDPNLKLVD